MSEFDKLTRNRMAINDTLTTNHIERSLTTTVINSKLDQIVANQNSTNSNSGSTSNTQQPNQNNSNKQK